MKRDRGYYDAVWRAEQALRSKRKTGGEAYRDPKTEHIEDWRWQPLKKVQEKLDLSEIPSHVLKFGEFMDKTAQRAALKGLTPRDLIKAYTIARASIQRKARPALLVRQSGLILPSGIKDEELVRPEGAFGHWLHTKQGQKYLDEAEAGRPDEEAIADASQKMAPFGKHEKDIPDALRWAAENLPGQEGRVSELVKRAWRGQSDPSEWRDEMKLRGIGSAKSGFVGSLLGRGDQPTLDARQIVEHTGRPTAEASPYLARMGGRGGQEAVQRLAARQTAMDLKTPSEMQPFYQHLAHHAFWDKAGNEQTTHSDVINALQHANKGGRIAAARGRRAELPTPEHMIRGMKLAGFPAMAELHRQASANPKLFRHIIEGTHSPFSDDPESVKKALAIASSLKVPVKTRLMTDTPYYNINQPTSADQVTSTVGPLRGATPKSTRSMTWEDLHREGKGGSFINLGGDRSRSGTMTHIMGKKLAWPVKLYAGPSYMKEYNPGSVWASAPGPSSGLLNLTKELSKGDKPVYGMYAPMGAQSADSAHHMFDALMAQVPGSNIDPKMAAKFDEALKAGLHMEADKRARAQEKMAKWPGILNAKEASKFAQGLTGEQRSSIVKFMDKTPWLKAGFPAVGITRVAITDPEMLTASGNMVGHRVVRLDPDRMVKEKIKHTTYKAPTAGEYVGDLPPVQRQYAMPDPMLARAQIPAAGGRLVHPYSSDPYGRSTTRKLFEEQKQVQQLTPEQLENVSQGLERQSAYGLAKGGRAVRADGGPVDQSDPSQVLPPGTPSYIKPIDEGARRLSPIGLYSHAAEETWKQPQMKGSPEQFKAMLQKRGVKPDEFKWSGYDQAFAGKKSVSKREVRDHFVKNLPKVQETVLSHDDRKATNYDYDPDTGVTGGPKYEDYQLPGGRNYREVVMHLPSSRNEERKAKIGALQREAATLNNPATRTLGDVERLSEIRSQLATLSDNPRVADEYHSSHWDVPNVLAHLRMSDREGPPVTSDEPANHGNTEVWQSGRWVKAPPALNKGKRPSKILHLEELQSDWGQEARDRGFALSPEEAKEKRTLQFIEHPTPEQEARLAALQPKSAYDAVPRAPYVDSTAKWTDLGLKRALWEAAKGGYDKLVVTPGDEQAKRYDLSQHVSKIHYQKDSGHTTIYDHRGQPMSEQTLKPEQLAATIGKEAAEKLLSSEPVLRKRYLRDDYEPMHVLEGGGLKIGGEGMKGYYDKILPGQLEKLARQHDPEARVKLHDMQLGKKQRSIDEIDRDMDRLHDQGDINTDRELGRRHALLQNERNDAKIHPTGQKLHVIDITPKMRASILQGHKAYASGGAVNGDQNNPPEDDASDDALYHVTLTKHLPKIQKDGIRPLQTSNWVQAGNRERYGGGHIFAFDHPHDAEAWGARMDWDHHKQTGSGKVSIVKFKRDGGWQKDTADPLSQSGHKGSWLKKVGSVKPGQIVSHVPVTTEMVRGIVKRNNQGRATGGRIAERIDDHLYRRLRKMPDLALGKLS